MYLLVLMEPNMLCVCRNCSEKDVRDILYIDEDTHTILRHVYTCPVYVNGEVVPP